MSLIHWWPLNGDTQDKIGNIKLTGTFTSNTSGKIGSCAQQNSARLTASTTSLANLKSFSIAMWVKFSSTASTAWCDLFGFNMKKGTTTDSMRAEVTSNGGSNFSVFCNSISGSSGGYANFSLSKDVWTHLAFIKDGGTVSTYKNGVLSATNTLTNFVDAYATGEFHIGDSNFYAAYNDVRIYDHVLSQAEVKELSKALVVHYTFDDILIEPTTNIITGIKSVHGKASLESGRVKINWSPSKGDSYFMFNYSQAIKANSVYTLSFDCEGLKSGEVARFAVSNLSAASYNIVLNNGRNSLTFTAGSDLMNDINTHNRLFFDDTANTDGAVFYLSNFQLEEHDHATPYTPTSRESMLYNETSLIQPNHKANLQLTHDAGSGTYSLKCAGSTAINTPVTGDISQGATAAFWIKTPTYPGSSSQIVFADYNSRLAFGFYNSTQAIISCGGQSSAVVSNLKTSWQSGWNHVVITRNNSTFSCYLNGTKLAQSGSNNWSSTAGYSTIGCRYNGSYTNNSNCLISDFRLYYSLLSEDEIKDLCKTKAYVTDQGDVETHQFIEGCNNLQVTNSHCVETRDIQEIGNGEYEQLEYIASDGSQYIDTGVYWTSEKATIVADLMVTAWKASSTIFGSEERYNGSSRYFAHILHAGSANNNYANYIGTTSHGTATSLTKDTRYVLEYIAHGNNTFSTKTTNHGTGEVKIYNNKVPYNGTILTHQNSTQTAANRGHIYIFSNHNAFSGTGGIQTMGAMRLYRFTMIQDDIYLRDFIPCRRKSDSKVGLFDLVTGQFYTTPTTKDFIAGNVIANEDIAAKFLSGGSIQARQFVEI